MKLSLQRVRGRCAAQGLGLGAALARAGVSRNAFYSLARRPSVIPGSLNRLAATLGVAVAELLDETPTPVARARAQALLAGRVAASCGANVENVRHTLLLLDEAPVDRLRRALRRGRQLDLR